MSLGISNELSNNMRSCGRKLLIVFAILQLTNCIYSQEQDTSTVGNAEPNLLILEQVEEYTTEKNTDPELYTTTDVATEINILLADEKELNIQSETIKSTIEDDQVSTSIVDVTEKSDPQPTGKPKCLCDCDTGLILDPTHKQQCPDDKPDIENTFQNEVANTENETESSPENEPISTNNNESADGTTENQTESQTNSPIDNQTDSKTNSPTESQTELQTEPQTTTQSESPPDPIETTTSNSAAAERPEETILTPCTSAGDFADDNDCQLYYTCVPQPAGTTSVYQRVEKSCSIGSAYNTELARCTRDISFCNDGSLPCNQIGTFPDPQGNSSYYWCVAKLNSAAGGVESFHKYRVQCPIGEIFVSQLGKCFIDINNLQNLPSNYGQPDLEDDEDIIKAELKQFKLTEKLRLKEQKLKDKMEQKLQKELAKKAAKDAKEQTKKLKGGSKEVEQFVCTEEGNYPSTLSLERYFTCISKKGKFKAVSMQCPLGNIFDAQRAVCQANNNMETDDDDEDDEDD